MSDMKRSFLIVAFFAVVFSACTSKRSHEVDFYYWKSKCAIRETERDYFNQLGSKRLFIRLFDVDIDGGRAVPVGQIQGFGKEQLPNDSTKVIPVVFITNRTFYNYANDTVAERLAYNVSKTIEHIMGSAGVAYDEIQLDCDWTERTRNAYFHFLEKLAEQSGCDISCTLRLHQIHDRRKTGVPPVVRGSLMCYATSNPMEGDTRNSILDMELLKAYTAKVKLVNGLTEDDLQTPMFEKTGDNLYLVKEDGFLQGLYVNSGFTVKIETITPELLAEAKRYLDRQIDRDFPWVYFHLSQGYLTRYSINNLK